MLQLIGKTDVGKVRKTNQDDYAYGQLPGGAVWAVVCDGMGGANGGSVASSMAVRSIEHSIQSRYDGRTDDEAVRALLFSALMDANAQVYARAGQDVSLYGMGTTVVACIATADLLFVAHAGDSRAYLLDREATQLTRDHSVVQEMVDSGEITAEEARNHPNKNIITRALGVEPALKIDFGAHPFPKGAGVLLCSDGLSNLVESESFVQAMREDSETAAEKLTALANENGGTDNITVVMIVNRNDQE
ncbi:Stp1/IreP family PP2C-type Ser/Thr phosphatase [Ethanoligenens harbinense]|uniref:Protein serine/threonine phosphatase n=1 Tax=Ethanoligenens harbinense (strain DSM 18485 / JCM 12961 / CGMCC 1.5033 / YUAN-3) TaxID=663278 RepID=E6U3M8_ETHHY|nr:Stp1/IreP family PP2C-type Ser/Thr phosphatase [Ethanoligenens harbinense]ADU27628.1 protein serine/threonine phosphatase [Ethanoligenens harbinense YUAN-3]